MQSLTLKKYQTRARNFYRKHCESQAPDSAQICAALLEHASEYRPNSFGTLKSALAHDQKARGNHQAAKAIKQLVNPVTAQGSTLPKKPKLKQIRSVSEEDYRELQEHLLAHEFMDETLSLVLAYYLGVRPCEMRTITVTDNRVHIIGGKKNATQDRGADRTLVIEDPAVLQVVADAAKWMRICPRTNTAIRDRLRKECRALWPRRKQHPTLKSFRHQLGSNLKASGESDEAIAYMMGHQSIESISVYGNRRSGAGHKLYIRPAPDADLSKVRQPKQPAVFGRGRVVGLIEVPQRLTNRLAKVRPSESDPRGA
ncbi:site-specific integrase [Pseudomonas aeruginosa]|uniref:site-specific integrase n=1 Tax=Pseudomonas aeruginosa TaxID=287 RepID=UPI0029675555|nr:site-specific integrase [Pseudomonas aeruginosa]MDW2963181.1 site-specific integrase [Pseudomonas aeruginosa]HEP8117511.1 site-specific integrase [Pseudomonas aeruginosa]